MTFLRDHLLVPVLRLPGVQNAILDRAAELGVNYRDSSLSAESTERRSDAVEEWSGVGARVRFSRGPRAGDRAPDGTGRREGEPGPTTSPGSASGAKRTSSGRRVGRC